MKTVLGRSLLRSKAVQKQRADKSSVAEYRCMDFLRARARSHSERCSTPSLVSAGDVCRHENSKSAIYLDFSKSVPPRVPFNLSTKTHFGIYEQKSFNHWLSKQRQVPYERNLETWRQLWLTCERSDVIAQILDARNPEFFFVKDLFEMYPEKKHVLLVNKFDLFLRNSKPADFKYLLPDVGSAQTCKHYLESYCFLKEYSHVFYSSKHGRDSLVEFLEKFKGLKVGLVGYPNVGKSSTMNLVLGNKKTRTSQTPGKTKHLQTIVFGNSILIDCPGIVFPRHEKFDLIVNGVLNVDQIVNYDRFIGKLMTFVGEDTLQKKYQIKKDHIEELLNDSGISKGQLFKRIVKDYVSGGLCTQ